MTPPPGSKPESHKSIGHTPVMLDAVVEALAPREGGIYVDGTFGAGGYARAILDAAPCTVWGIDRDPDAVARGAEMARAFDGRLTVLAGRFGDMGPLLAGVGIDLVDGIALDLGISSFQLETDERGFSFRRDGPLDMRMERSGASAADVVNTLDEGELADIIYRYGEERASRRVARAIVAARAAAPIQRTGELADLVRRAVGRRRDGLDPATRTFQALRIHVNDELGELDLGLSAAETLLRAGGRLAVVSFHSLEDRIVKEFLHRRSGRTARPSRHLPEPPETTPESSFRLLGRGTTRPTDEEVAANRRARSARLRAAERTTAAGWPANTEARR